MATALVPAGKYQVVNQNGDPVMEVDGTQVQQFMQWQQRQGGGGAGGGNTLSLIGSAVQVGGGIIIAGEIRDYMDEARDAAAKIYDERKKLYAYLNSTSVVDGKTLKGLIRAVDVQQDRIDRAQDAAQTKAITVIWAEVFGAGLQAAGQLGYGGGDSLDGNSTASLLAAGGIGAVLGLYLSNGNNSGGRGRRYSSSSDDETSNVPE